LSINDDVEPAASRALVTLRLIDRLYQLSATVVKWGALIWIASYVAQSVEFLAGQRTDASFSFVFQLIKKTGSAGLGEFIWALIALIAVIYGVVQKRLRRRAIEHFSSHIRVLEMALDSKRSSSELTHDGRTNPRDL